MILDLWRTSQRVRQVGLGIGLNMPGDLPNIVLVPKVEDSKGPLGMGIVRNALSSLFGCILVFVPPLDIYLHMVDRLWCGK